MAKNYKIHEEARKCDPWTGEETVNESSTRDSPDGEISDWVLKISRIKMLRNPVEKVYKMLKEQSDYSRKIDYFLNQTKTPLEMRNTRSEIKNSIESQKRKMDTAQERTNKLKDRSI